MLELRRTEYANTIALYKAIGGGMPAADWKPEINTVLACTAVSVDCWRTGAIQTDFLRSILR